MKRIILVVCLIIAFFLGACSVTVVSAEQNYPLKIWSQNRNGQIETWQLVDESTGVNYIVVAPRYSNGNSYDGIAIMPRLNADGSLYVSN